MPAEWKKSPLEKAKRKTPVQDRDQRIAALEAKLSQMQMKLDEASYKNEHLIKLASRFEEQRDEAIHSHAILNWLKQQDVMLADEDGFKLLKGDELLDHCRARAALSSPSKQSAVISQALARSMQQMKQEAAAAIMGAFESVSYPGIKG